MARPLNRTETPTKITKISEEPKIFLERFYADRKTPKFTGHLIEMPRELVNEPIGTVIWLDGYETGRIPNRPADKIVKEPSIDQTQAGYRVGMIRWYYESGNINQEQAYEGGLANGLKVTYHDEPGQMKTKSTNYKNKMLGMSVKYDVNGKIKSKTMYKENIPNGLMEYFWENGKIRERGNRGGPPEFDRDTGVCLRPTGNGRRTGLWEIFDEEGNKIEERWFPDKWDEKGNPLN